LAKKTKEILFLKIQNDGYGLGAQRREIDKNDLPQALEIIKEYKTALKENKKFKLNEKQGKIAHLVAKEKIAESGDYNLSGDRYIEAVNFANQKWALVAVGDICDLGRGRVISKKDIEKHGGIYLVYSSQTTNDGIFGSIDSYDFDGEYVTWTTDGANAGTVFYRSGKFNCTNVCGTLKAKTDEISMKYLAKILNTVAYKYVIHVGNPKLMNNVMAKIKIPLPPLEVQKEIVEQIEVKQKAIEAAKAVIENLERERRYFGQEIRKIKDVDLVELGGVLEYEQPTKYIVKSVNYSDEYKTPVLTAGQTFILGYTNENDGIFSAEKLPVIIFDDFTTATKFVDFAFKVKSSAMKILHTKREKADTKFLFYAMQDIKFNHDTHKRYWISEYSKIKIPLPSLEIQKHLVAGMGEQEKIIEANKKLVGIMEQKITGVLSEI
ncbi:MAG: hypothetical protein AUK23_09600, partial [Deltaproteobacteria bacterium CG2_30_43_15]